MKLNFFQIVTVAALCVFLAVSARAEEYNWGPQSQGFALSLTLSKGKYQIGKSFPVYIACTRFTNSWRVKVSPNATLCDANYEIRDSHGDIVPEGYCVTLGGGQSSEKRGVAKGEVVPAPANDLKTCYNNMKLGLYTITAVWNPSKSDAPENVEIRSNTVTFEAVQ